MTTSTAPLVDVIAGVLESHLGMERETWNIDPEYFREQARAALAAISEAGTVEWGVFRKSTGTRVGQHIFESAEQAAAWVTENYYEKFASQLEPRSRITFPWERAE